MRMARDEARAIHVRIASPPRTLLRVCVVGAAQPVEVTR